MLIFADLILVPYRIKTVFIFSSASSDLIKLVLAQAAKLSIYLLNLKINNVALEG